MTDQRPVQSTAVHQALRRTAHADDRIATVHGAVIEAHAHVASHRSDPGLGQDLDAELAGEVDFRRELVARDPDRLDQRFRRQFSSLEAVDEDLGVWTGDVDQLPPQFVGVVRQRLDLFARHDSPEGDVPIRGGRLAIARHGDVGLQAVDRQHQSLPVVARAHPDVREGARLESRELGAERIPSRREVLKCGLPLCIGCRCQRGRCLGGRFGACKRHVRAGQDRPRFIDDGDDKRGVAGRLRERLRCGEKGKTAKNGDTHSCLPVTGHFTASNLRGSIRALSRKRSKVVSSVVSLPMARRSRNGRRSPSTSR